MSAATILDIVTDFIGSVIVILTAGTSYWFPELHTLKLYMDPVLSMIMVILIMSSTIPLGKRAREINRARREVKAYSARDGAHSSPNDARRCRFEVN